MLLNERLKASARSRWREGGERGSYSFLPHDHERENTKEQTETSQSFRREQVPFPVTGQDGIETWVNQWVLNKEMQGEAEEQSRVFAGN